MVDQDTATPCDSWEDLLLDEDQDHQQAALLRLRQQSIHDDYSTAHSSHHQPRPACCNIDEANTIDVASVLYSNSETTPTGTTGVAEDALVCCGGSSGDEDEVHDQQQLRRPLSSLPHPSLWRLPDDDDDAVANCSCEYQTRQGDRGSIGILSACEHQTAQQVSSTAEDKTERHCRLAGFPTSSSAAASAAQIREALDGASAGLLRGAI